MKLRDARDLNPNEAIAGWIRKNSVGNETLFAWDSEPAIYAITGLDPVTAQIDAHHLYDSPRAAARWGPDERVDAQDARPRDGWGRMGPTLTAAAYNLVRIRNLVEAT